MEYVNRATGAAKEAIGQAIGNDKMAQEGHAKKAQAVGEQQIQQNEANAKHASEQAKAAAQQAGDKASNLGGQAKERVGEMFGSQQMQGEGRAQQASAQGEDLLHGQQKSMHESMRK
ncbi:hypothetical protein H4R26_000305 [Coemansia thaxteri]|uniref:CsbD-like domain-containing protein n=1 Tax=Coemansia thaxteri TaxID=2663907 RepID=A0A9W8EMA3_9FUNG|nr:hypothetical protein H4R26_000305 [Coemansia thaxteri]KAJ2475968.1 hypothetical protein EV174_005091 [Coemansia sp. RSA 2320]